MASHRPLWTAVSTLIAMVSTTGCGTDTDKASQPDTAAAGSVLDLACPGAEGCASNEGSLLAGAAALDMTPTCWESWDDLDGNGEYSSAVDVFNDCGCDRLCPGDDGYTSADDGEADGTFQALWLAGFGNGRAMASVHDSVDARAIVVSSGDTSVAVVSLDVVGWFYDDTLKIRQAVAAAGSSVDLVVVQATHNHEAPDTMGQWGSRFGERGVDDRFLQQLVDGAAQAVLEAEASLTEVTLVVGEADSAAPFGDKGTRNTVRDSRDPVIIDEMVGAAHFVDSSGRGVATLVHWANHPEVLGDSNTALTSDFPWAMREAVESGLSYDSRAQPGVGGVAIYLQGPVGGLMTPLGITVTDWDGIDHTDANFDKARALGDIIGGLALDAIDSGTPASEPRVSFGSVEVDLPVENLGFQAMFLMGVFERELFGYDETQILDDDNMPWIRTEVDLLKVGPLRLLTMPGEITPELVIGGYDGSRVNSSEVEFVAADNPNPPDLSGAPAGPYLKERLGGELAWVLGLGNDELGYLLPSYNFVLDDRTPYLTEADGDHYEETNSIGPSAVPLLFEAADLVMAHTP